jgi:hypothetical protein
VKLKAAWKGPRQASILKTIFPRYGIRRRSLHGEVIMKRRQLLQAAGIGLIATPVATPSIAQSLI